MDYSDLLADIVEQVRPLAHQGQVADYIPALALVQPGAVGLALATLDGQCHLVGDAQVRFSMQSISKLFALTLAMQRVGDGLWQRVGREPSGTRFNSLIQLEHENGIPRNPFVNAGALVVVDALCRRFVQPEFAVLQFLHRLLGTATVQVDDAVAQSERTHSHRNAAIAHFMKSFGNLESEVDVVLDAYCRQCAIAISCSELASAALFLASDGVAPDGTRILSALDARRVNAMLLTCGAYDAAGEFAFRIGLPVKSGVGGGILAIVPGVGALCAWSPTLDRNGNSIAAAAALERFVAVTGVSVFAARGS